MTKEGIEFFATGIVDLVNSKTGANKKWNGVRCFWDMYTKSGIYFQVYIGNFQNRGEESLRVEFCRDPSSLPFSAYVIESWGVYNEFKHDLEELLAYEGTDGASGNP